MLIRRGLAALDARRSARRRAGPYALQAAIAACHARARTAEETDWGGSPRSTMRSPQVTPSPVVELNRAVAVAMAFGPEAGLELVDALAGEPSLRELPPAAERARRPAGEARPLDEARAEFERAAALTENERERALLLERAAACDS